MPAAGRKPPPLGQDGKPAVRHRNKAAHEWTEVERVRFEDGPRLPRTAPGEKTWPARTKTWWSAISSMPHCILWDDEDWQFAIDTAYIHAAFSCGDMKVATELRNREKVLGTTVDFRRDLRIRYVEPTVEVPEGVTAIQEYRKMLEG